MSQMAQTVKASVEGNTNKGVGEKTSNEGKGQNNVYCPMRPWAQKAWVTSMTKGKKGT